METALVPWVVDRTGGRDTLVANPDPEVQTSTAYEQWDVQQRLRVRSRRGHAELNVQHSTTGDVPRFDVQNDVSGDLPKWAEWNYGPQERTLVALSGSRALRGGAVWSTLASYQAVEESRIKRRFGHDWRVTQLEELEVWGATSTVRGHRRGVTWEAGMDGSP